MTAFERTILRQLAGEWELYADRSPAAARKAFRTCAANLRAALGRLDGVDRALAKRVAALRETLDREADGAA